MQERVKSKTRLTVDVDAVLVAAANVEGIDLAELLEQALSSRLQQSGRRRPAALSDDDRASIEAHNQLIAKNGTLTDAIRKYVK